MTKESAVEYTDMPTGWIRVPVRDVAAVIGGGTPTTASPELWEGNIPWVTSADIDERGTVSIRRRISAAAVARSATNLVPTGTILVATRVGLGKVAFAPTAMCFSQDCQGVIYERRLADGQYLGHYLRSAAAIFKYVSRGTTIAGVTKKQLLDLELRLPPLPEQHRIVAEIEKQFTRLDAAVAGLKRVRANLKRYRAATLAAACEGRLVPTEAELAGGGPPAGTGTLPAGWEFRDVASLSAVQGGIQKQPSREPKTNAFPYLRVANVLRGRLDLSETFEMELFNGELEKLRLEQGDLLVVEGNGSPSQIGRMALWNGAIDNCVHQNHIIRIRCKDGVMPEYFQTFWNSPFGAKQVREVASSTSGLYTLSVGKISKLRVPLPPLPEQVRIVAEVDRRLSLVDSLETVMAVAERRAVALRQSILKCAFEGRLVPQNPDDEPATALLGRIRAERPTAATKGAAVHTTRRKARA